MTRGLLLCITLLCVVASRQVACFDVTTVPEWASVVVRQSPNQWRRAIKPALVALCISNHAVDGFRTHASSLSDYTSMHDVGRALKGFVEAHSRPDDEVVQLSYDGMPDVDTPFFSSFTHAIVRTSMTSADPRFYADDDVYTKKLIRSVYCTPLTRTELCSHMDAALTRKCHDFAVVHEYEFGAMLARTSGSQFHRYVPPRPSCYCTSIPGEGSHQHTSEVCKSLACETTLHHKCRIADRVCVASPVAHSDGLSYVCSCPKGDAFGRPV